MSELGETSAKGFPKLSQVGECLDGVGVESEALLGGSGLSWGSRDGKGAEEGLQWRSARA